MIRIVNGKRYNTETATTVANWTNGDTYTSFNYEEETLMVTENENHFLWQEYGYMGTRSSILALSTKESLTWLQHRNIDITDELLSVLGIEIVEA